MLSKTEAGAKKGSVAAGGNIKDTTINIGVAAEDLLEQLKESQRNEGRFQVLLEQERDKVTHLSNTLEVTEQAVFGFLEILDEQDIGHDQIESKLREIAERHVDLLARLHALSNDAPDIVHLRERAAQFIDAGKYDDADRLLEEAEEIDQRYIAEQREALEQRQLSAAETRARRGEISLTRLRYLEAGEHFKAAAELVPPSEDLKQADYLSQRARAFHDHGREKGDSDALRQAVLTYTQVSKVITCDRETKAWVRLQNELGYTHVILGEREGDAARLKEAVAIFRSVLEECDRESLPKFWAKTQENLGNALRTLGRVERNAGNLEEAVAVYRLALEERTRDHAPLDWAKTQNHLGAALSILGQQNGDAARLAEAIVAYRAALEERTRDQVPIDWARTQSNLSHALAVLGRWTHNTDTLEKADAACQKALSELSCERTPIYWAAAQGGLASALVAWGEIKGDTSKIEKAVETYELSANAFEGSGADFLATSTREELLATKALLKSLRDGKALQPSDSENGSVAKGDDMNGDTASADKVRDGR